MPLDLESIDKFDPESVPTLGQLLQELDTIGMSIAQDQARESHSGVSESFILKVELNILLIVLMLRLGKNFLEALY